MDLKMRPMAEAPEAEQLIVARRRGNGIEYRFIVLKNEFVGDALGFWTLPDLLRASDTLRKITPEGFEYTGEIRKPKDGEFVIFEGHVVEVGYPGAFGCEYPILRRIQPPLEYKYVTESKPRNPRTGDWCWFRGAWTLVTEEWTVEGLFLCATRREVTK